MPGRMKGKPSIVAFSGIDGSGKTTLAKILIERLWSEGLRAEYVWCRHESGSLSLIVALLKRLSQSERGQGESHEKYYSSLKYTLLGKPVLRFFYRVYAFLDYLVEVESRVRKRIARAEVLVVDRYILDTVADVAAECSMTEIQSMSFYRLLTRNLPKPLITILVLVPAAVSVERKSDIIDNQYLARRLRVYRLLEVRPSG